MSRSEILTAVIAVVALLTLIVGVLMDISSTLNRIEKQGKGR